MCLRTICRICLQNGAVHPIFQTLEKDGNLRSKIFFCLQVNIENIEGYPRKICNNCKVTIETFYDFLNKFKETCRILENGLLKIKQENDTEADFDRSLVLDNSFNISNIKCELNIEANSNLSKKINNEIDCVKPKNCRKIDGSKITGTNKIMKIGEELSDEQNVTNIKESETKLPPPPKLCDICGEVFKDQDKLSLHKKKTHFKNPVKCPKCPRICVSEYYLRCHIKRRHDNEKKFKCATCNRAFAFKGELSSHYKNVHNKDLKPKKLFACKICNKTYKSAKSVVVHERSMHTGDRPAVCTVCGNSFFHEDYLKEHMRLHTGETPFKCPICGRGYAQRCNMKSHLRVHKVSELNENLLKQMKPNYIKLLKA